MSIKRTGLLFSFVFLLGWLFLYGADKQEVTFWTAGENLMPAWGFYPNGSTYGETKPLVKASAWTIGGTNNLTWVADFPADGTYNIWIRRYGGYGKIEITVDEKNPIQARGGRGGAKYVWLHKGTISVKKGMHHVDMNISNSMFDAILFTTSDTFNPEGNTLPEPVKDPVTRAFRKYRNASHLKTSAGGRKFILGRMPLYEENFYDWVPSEGDVIRDRISLWGAPNQYVNGTFGIRAFEEIKKAEVSLKEVLGPDGKKISSKDIDLRVVSVRERVNQIFSWPKKKGMTAEILLRDSRTQIPPDGRQGGFGGGSCTVDIPAEESRQIWLTVHIPEGYPAGNYKGVISIKTDEETCNLNLEMEILPLELKQVEGYYSIYYPLQPINKDRPNYVTEERYLSELEDMVRHGLNTVTLYGGFPTLHLAKSAGMTRPPCIMGWPDSRAVQWIKEAKEMGFDELLFYGVDEPRTEEQIGRSIKEEERRSKLGFKTMTAINSKASWEALRDLLDLPVLNIYVFGGKDAEAPMYAREKGFYPISYWTSATSYPLWFRSLTGLYNTACGYLGTSPWAYTDFPDPDKKYSADLLSHQLTYPDEYGYPIPTLQWESYRAGIDDVRYLQGLERAIEKGEKRLKEGAAPEGLLEALNGAKEVYKKRFESIDGRWFQYLCRLTMKTLEDTRREFAEATVKIERLLGTLKDEGKNK